MSSVVSALALLYGKNNKLMKQALVEYKTANAGEKDVYAHLQSCNANFVPPLEERVDLSEYAKKIIERSVTFEAWHDGSLGGLIAAYFNDPAGKTAFITNVSVVKELMGTGVASQLLKECVSYAIKKNYTEIKLEVNKDNFPAISFYRKYNFTEDGIKDDCLILKKEI